VRRDPVDLIETLAERIAGVVLAHPPVEAVRVTVHKPNAPIEVPFSDVAVTIERERG
jgi:dihydroneopterin aldolase